MTTRRVYNTRLDTAEILLRKQLQILEETSFDTALVLGTGWGDSLDTGPHKSMNLVHLPGGENLDTIEGHKRRIEIGNVGGRDVLILRGRVHMNESTFNPDAAIFVRMQIELLLRLGVKNLILTCGAGGLTVDATPGKVYFINSFISDFGEVLPLFAGEFVSPEEMLDAAWRNEARNAVVNLADVDTLCGSYVFYRGPQIEGIRHDKGQMLKRGGSVVGMSIKPECAIAALYKDKGVRVLALAHVMNGSGEVLNHIVHTEKAQTNSVRLGAILTNIVADLPA